MDKVNEKTAKRLMAYLEDDQSDWDGVITAKQCLHLMLFACVLYLKYVENVENKPEIKIDKKKLKKVMMPSFDWMKEHKFKEKDTIKKRDYKVLGEWLIEFYETKRK